MLIVLSGLPSRQDDNRSRELARSLVAVHLRIDSIEQALRQAGWAVEAEGTRLPKPSLLTTCALVTPLSPTA
jgi:predicted kinase